MLKTFALIGNPNCGKTTLFNSLTGSTAHVGNWPGVTVEKREGKYKKDKKDVANIVDLPGIYSLSPYTSEEVISRNYILKQHPDCVINVIDVMNLERSLFLTSQLLEMNVPVVIALNMLDLLNKNNMSIDVDKIAEELQVPVVSISALKFTNLDSLMDKALKACENKREGKVIFNTKKIDLINKAKAIYDDLCIENSLFHAIKALEDDKVEKEDNINAYDKVKKEGLIVENFEKETAEERYAYFKDYISNYRVGSPLVDSNNYTKSDKVDKVLTHKIFAIPILLIILFLIFHITFSGDLFFLHSFGVDYGEGYAGLLSFNSASGEEFHPFAGLFYDENGIASLGEFLKRFFEGINNSIIEGIRLGIHATGGQEWVEGFICDGILTGVFAVLGFLPQILLLFAFFSIMEDSGYMARVAFILDKIFRRFGVSGRAFIPMIMGFGCGVPAMINTRTLNSDKERAKTIRVIPFFTCSAKSEILAGISAAFATAYGFEAGAFTFLMYLLGMVVAITAIIVMNKTTLREDVPPFIMELPSYQLPQVYALTLHIFEKAKHFVKKAFTIIFLSTIIIWIFANFTFDWKFIPTIEESEGINVSNSILAGIGMLIQPIFTPLGWGSQLNTVVIDGVVKNINFGWIYSVGAIQGTIAKENVVGTLGTLGSLIGDIGTADPITYIVQATQISEGGIVSFTVFNMLTIPCFASVATAKSEIGDKKLYRNTIIFWLVSSYVIAALFFVMIDYKWTIGIILPVIVLIGVGLYFYDKYKNKNNRGDSNKPSLKEPKGKSNCCCD